MRTLAVRKLGTLATALLVMTLLFVLAGGLGIVGAVQPSPRPGTCKTNPNCVTATTSTTTPPVTVTNTTTVATHTTETTTGTVTETATETTTETTTESLVTTETTQTTETGTVTSTAWHCADGDILWSEITCP